MSRREIKQLFEQMGLTYYPSKNPKNERWRIPNEEITIRILVYQTVDKINFSSAPDPVETHWAIQITGRFASSLTVPEEAIAEIQRIIYAQFERQFNKPGVSDWDDFIGGGQWRTTWSSYQPVILPPDLPKQRHLKPTATHFKPQPQQNRPRVHRLGYSGKR